MTYFPDDPRALAALDALEVPGHGPMSSGIGQWDRDALRQVLLAVVCPAPCTGATDPDGAGWHAACEQAADDALAALDRDMRPPAWGLTPPPGWPETTS